MNERVPELRDTLAVLWRRKIFVVVSIITVTLLAVWYSARQPDLYQARSRIVIRSIAPGVETNSDAHHDVTAETQGEVIRSEIVAARVAKLLSLDVPPQALSAAISTRVVTEELIEITATSLVPQRAADLANGFAREYLSYRDEGTAASVAETGTDLKRRLDDLQKQIATLDAKIVTLYSELARLPRPEASPSASQAAERAEREAEVRRLTAERDSLIVNASGVRTRYEDVRSRQSSGSGGTLISPATVPAGRSSPNPKRDGVVGLLLGLIAGVGLAFLREHFDDRVRGVEDASHAAGVPVLASIPRTKQWRRRKEAYLAAIREPGAQTAEAYRQLRQGLVARGLGTSMRRVVFTSGGASAGKSTSVANTAVVAAQAGMRVVCVSADLRRPRLHAFFGVSNDAGLSNVLAGDLSVQQALRPTGIQNLTILPSGPVPPNAAELLDGARLERVLSDLSMLADVVIIDAPPLSSGADALVLAPRSDMAVLVLRQDMASASGTAAAVQELRGAGVHEITAAVTFGSDAGTKRHAYYYYEAGVDRMRNGSPDSRVAVPAHSNGNGVVAVPARLDAADEPPRAPRRRAAKPKPERASGGDA